MPATTAVHEQIVLRALLVALGIQDAEITRADYAGMLRARGADFALMHVDGRLRVGALFSCDRCWSYHESGPITDLRQVELFVASGGGLCPS